MNKWRIQQGEIYYYLLLLIAITLPFPFYALNNILIILLGVNWMVKLFLEKKIAIEKTDITIALGLILLFFLYLMGVFYSSNKHDAWALMERKLTLLFLPLIIGSSPILSSQRLTFILRAFLISCTFISVLCVIYTFWLNKQLGIEFVYYNMYQFSEENLIRKFGFHHVYFSMYLCFCQVIIIYLISQAPKLHQQIGLFFLAMLLVLFMLGLGSRMGAIIFTVLISLAVLLLIRGSYIFKLSLIVGLLVLFVMVGYQFTFIREKFTGLLNIDVNQYTKMYQASNRMVSITSTWNIFKANWLFGIGTGGVNDVLIREYERIDFQEGLIHTYNPHNQYLDTAASIGIFGFLSLLSVLFYSLYIGIRNRDFIVLSFSLIILFSFLTESMLSRQKGVVFFAFFLCILVLRRKDQEPIMKF